MKVISLGWGVQSFTMAVMSVFRDLPKVDAAIHCDTLHESALTYEFADRWRQWLIDRRMNVVTVKNPTGGFYRIKENQIMIPAYTANVKGNNGQLMRTCTQRWKIAPMRSWLQKNRKGEQVEMWLGISTDEAVRIKPSDVKYVTNRHPLIELDMSRADCENYLIAHGIEVPPKSACTFCPFHDTKEWRRIQANSEDWSEAVKIDNLLRHRRKDHEIYIHPSRKPITDVDLRTDEQKGQYRLWDDECSGICGV